MAPSAFKPALIVLHEIYGINSHIIEVCQQYSALGFSVYCPNLLTREETFEYSQEQEAYTNFCSTVGFIAPPSLVGLLKHTQDQHENVVLMGFSAGAAVAWNCAAMGLCSAMVGYYGSRIRDYLNTPPSCPTLLIFAEKETGFSPADLLPTLQAHINITPVLLPGAHGFCDPHNQNFHPVSAESAQTITTDFLYKLGLLPY